MDLTVLLNRLEDRLREQGVPIVDVFAPGISAEEVSSALERLGMHPSEELLAWFGWHNGITPGQPQERGHTLFNWELFSLDRSIEAWHRLEPGPEVWDWNPAWLPIAEDAGMPWLAVQCLPFPGATSLVRCASPDELYFDETLCPSVPSFATAVTMWIDALDSGWLRWASDPGECDLSRRVEMPLDRRITGIV